jgi:hypothetical protein
VRDGFDLPDEQGPAAGGPGNVQDLAASRRGGVDEPTGRRVGSGAVVPGTENPAPGGWASESDRVYELLREDLIAGLLAPREPLVEQALAKRYKASRTPVRAAVLRLVGDRLLDARPHSPTIVREITTRDIRQIYEMRQAVEGFAIESAGLRIDRDQLRRLIAQYSASLPGRAEEAPEAVIHKGATPLHRLIELRRSTGEWPIHE